MDEAPSGKRVVGRRGKRRDADSSPVVTNWQTDVIRNREPGWTYEWPLETQVSERLRPSRLRLTDFETGESEIYDIPAWELVRRDTGPEELAGFRPDEGKPLDTLLRHGPHVCMRIKDEFKALLDRRDEQRSDAYESRLQAGRHYNEGWASDGRQVSPGSGSKVRSGEIRRYEEFQRE